MKLMLDTGVKKDLTDKQMATLDAKLRSRIPELIGWSYSPLTGELTLDFGDDSDLNVKIDDWALKADAVKKLRFTVMERLVKEWEE